MVSGQNALNWQSADNSIFLNPRWPKEDFVSLEKLARKSSEEKNIQSHIWVSTSGSSAEQISHIKLVALSKAAFLSSAAAVNRHLESTARDIWAQVLPLFHVGGIGIEARAFLSGAKVVPCLQDFKWDASYFYNILEKEKCTLSALVPTQVYDLVQLQKKAPASLRAIVVGGGALGEDLYKEARALGWSLLPSYGMTETCSQIATASLASLQQDIFPELHLLSHAEARKNAEGFLQIKGSSLLSFYAQNGRGVWDPKMDGWFTAEDKGEISGGVLQIAGRGQDFIKIGGEASSLSRLRGLLETAVKQIAPSQHREIILLDWPSERLGSEIHLVFTRQVSEEEREKICTAYNLKVLPFERIRAYHQVSSLPRSELGKVLTAELKRALL